MTTRRSSIFRGFAVAAAMVGVLASLVPTASAEFETGGGSEGGGAGGPGRGSGTSRCVNGEGYVGSAKVYNGWFFKCDGITGAVPNQKMVCHSGFEAWRFYGTESNPAMGWSVSRANLDRWCPDNAQNEVYTFPVPHPNDGGVDVGWPFIESKGRNPDREEYKRSTDHGRITPIGAFGAGGANCTQLMTGDPLAKYFAPGANPAQAAVVKEGLWKTYQRWYDGGNQGLALAVINSTYANGPNDIGYGDGLPCSSGLDFATTEGEERRVFGTCYIPLDRYTNRFTHPSGYKYAAWYKGGERYSTQYGPQSNMPEYRNIIWADRGGRSGPGTPFTSKSGTIAPLTVPDNSGAGRLAAAASASQYARCVRGNAATAETGSSSQAGVNPDGSQIVFTGIPEAFHAGGALQPHTVGAEFNGLYCGGQLCSQIPNGPELVSLSWTMTVNGTPASYVECRSAGELRCQWRKISSRSNGGEIKTSQSDELHFYSATQPNERMRLEITGASGVYRRYRLDTEWVNVCAGGQSWGDRATSPDCSRVETTTRVGEDVGFTPSVQGPIELKVVGATPTRRR